MRLDSYSAAAYETFEPWHGDADAAGQGSPEDLPRQSPRLRKRTRASCSARWRGSSPSSCRSPKLAPSAASRGLTKATAGR